MQALEHAVIAAAGVGNRLGHGVPKCLVEIMGRSILARQIQLLSDVDDVRVVVGFQEDRVVEEARRWRSDLIFVRNAAFKSNTTLDSYRLGAKHLAGPCLFMDGDIIFDRKSFLSFCSAATEGEILIGITPSKTEHAVYVRRNSTGSVIGFSYDQYSSHEWANIMVGKPEFLEHAQGHVFNVLSMFCPLPCMEIESYEIDTEKDLNLASEYLALKE